MAKDLQLSLGDWKGDAKNTLVQGLNYHRLAKVYIGHQADDVAGQVQQDVVLRQNKQADGDYLGAVTVKRAGHGSSTGLEEVDANTARVWLGHDQLKTSGYVQFDIGFRGEGKFTPVDLPEGDIEIDQDNNILVLRNGNRIRVYDFKSVKAGNRKKLYDWTYPAWGLRWQGMLVCNGRIFIHRDVKTGGESRAHMFDLKGKALNFPKKDVNWLDTSDMGTEAEGFFARYVADGVEILAVKRTGPEGAKRIIEGTVIIKLPKAVSQPTTPPKETTVTVPASYPPANRTAQWYPGIAGGGKIATVDKLVLHTTEGGGWFNYNSVGYGPHLTYNPKTREWRQHISLNASATALGNDGTYKTNQANVIQVEVIGYAKDGTKWNDTTVADIAALVKWLSNYGLKIQAPQPFPKYPGGSNERLTRAQYIAARGIYGHCHVPGNNHGDPGAIPIEKIVAAAKGVTTTSPKPTTPATDRELPAVPFYVPMPVVGGVVGYAYGVVDKGYKAGIHTGQDYKCPSGSTAVAVWGGVVQINANDPKGYGTWVTLQADNGRDYVYCHLSKVTVRDGERVVQGQEIAKTGSTGNSTGPHLHFEDRPRGGGYGNVRKPLWPSWDGKAFINAFVLGETHPAVTLLGHRLVAHLGKGIYDVGPGPKFGEADKAAVKKFQEKQGWKGEDADGIPGSKTWLLLLNLVR